LATEIRKGSVLIPATALRSSWKFGSQAGGGKVPDTIPQCAW
jgi:hypothetical protein